MKSSPRILPSIVISQFCCTSLWFAGNGVMDNLVSTFDLPNSALGDLTSAVQFGFITGTLIFAILTIADRFSPSKVFFLSALIAAAFNALTILDSNTLTSLLALRFATGFFLAGIYPVGMKIAADYYDKGLGKSLGYLVGALVVGTSFPHFLQSVLGSLPWDSVLLSTSGLALLGGLIMVALVPDGPYRKPGQKLEVTVFSRMFKNPRFRSAAFGYFGHMWELYAFWAFIPVMLATYMKSNPSTEFNTSFLSFLIIGLGGVACVIGGYFSQHFGTKRIAFIALLLSGTCCILSPVMFQSSELVFLVFLFFWGMVVIADSPLFSTLVAQNAEQEIKGSALTIVNCIGFSITIISIQLINILSKSIAGEYLYLILGAGPVLGLIALFKKN